MTMTTLDLAAEAARDAYIMVCQEDLLSSASGYDDDDDYEAARAAAADAIDSLGERCPTGMFLKRLKCFKNTGCQCAYDRAYKAAYDVIIARL